MGLNLPRLAATVVLTSFLAFPLYLISDQEGAEPGHTGGPFPEEQTCGIGTCHNVMPNVGPGSVSISANGAPLEQFQYNPGETVQLTVRVADPDQGRWGFSVTARTLNDFCQTAGVLAATNSDVRIQGPISLGPCSNLEYATHFFAKAGNSGQDFLVNWTAPATDVGPVMFAVAGNAANGDVKNTGDRIYTKQYSIQAAPQSPPPTPSISAGGIVLANLVPSVATAAPSAILSIFGQEFAAPGTLALTPSVDANGRVSTEMAGICVEIAGQRSPMFAVLPNQLNLQASDQIGLGPQAVTVIRACGRPNEVRSAPEMVDFAAAAPGFFVFTNFGGQNGVNPIAALHGGGPNVVAPTGLFQDNAQQLFSPAAAGEVISLFATGLGATNPSFAAGEIPQSVNPASPTAQITGTATVTIGGTQLPPEDVIYVGVAPCCAGLYQLVVRVPASLGAGQHEVIMTVDGVASPPGPFIPVQ